MNTRQTRQLRQALASLAERKKARQGTRAAARIADPPHFCELRARDPRRRLDDPKITPTIVELAELKHGVFTGGEPHVEPRGAAP